LKPGYNSIGALRCFYCNASFLPENGAANFLQLRCADNLHPQHPVRIDEPTLLKVEYKTNDEMISTDIIQANVYMQAIGKPVSGLIHARKLKAIRQYLPLALVAGCEIAGSMLTWISLGDNRIVAGCLGVMVLYLGYAAWKGLRDAESQCRIFAACCALLVMLSLLTGWTVEGIAPSGGMIVSALVSLTAAGYFIYKPSLIN